MNWSWLKETQLRQKQPNSFRLLLSEIVRGTPKSSYDCYVSLSQCGYVMLLSNKLCWQTAGSHNSRLLRLLLWSLECCRPYAWRHRSEKHIDQRSTFQYPASIIKCKLEIFSRTKSWSSKDEKNTHAKIRRGVRGLRKFPANEGSPVARFVVNFERVTKSCTSHIRMPYGLLQVTASEEHNEINRLHRIKC